MSLAVPQPWVETGMERGERDEESRQRLEQRPEVSGAVARIEQGELAWFELAVAVDAALVPG